MILRYYGWRFLASEAHLELGVQGVVGIKHCAFGVFGRHHSHSVSRTSDGAQVDIFTGRPKLHWWPTKTASAAPAT